MAHSEDFTILKKGLNTWTAPSGPPDSAYKSAPSQSNLLLQRLYFSSLVVVSLY